MAVIPLYLDVLRTLTAIPYGYPVWPYFEQSCYYPHRAFFEGFMATYGEDVLGPGGLPGAVESMAPALRERLRAAPWYGLEQQLPGWMAALGALLPGSAPNVYLGTLFFTAPAATLSVLGRPAIVLGLERFLPAPLPAQGEKYWYHPAEAVEMIPHEAAHAARMQALDLPATPRRLSLLDMIMLEGTALTFTDAMLGRQTLATFLPPDRMAWHRANEAQIRSAIAPDLEQTGMEVFLKYFSAGAPISGYYAGYSYCTEFLERHGPGSMNELITLPSRAIIEAVAKS
ncbi:MAG TPA: DUF2268 domain-containing putative Zn-dependent protease [Symbiobacteriaceae bacterium]|nr:DUF2268 domain-containing putative Zn-dependent protease [Symbiobacteriaceae bacterium]